MIPEFTLRLICGLSTVWCVASRRKITSGFFRIQMLLVLGLSVLVSVTANQIAPQNSRISGMICLLGIALSVASFLGSVFWTLERRTSGTWTALAVLILSTVGVLLPNFSASLGIGAEETAIVWNALSCAWLLGATTAAMLLGHWYLTATGMSLEPLKQYTLLFGGAALVRTLVVGALTLAGSAAAEGNWTLLILRWGGLVGPLILAALTWQILRYRNTQSATGVLYAATILVFMGEMAAALLSRSQAIPPGV